MSNWIPIEQELPELGHAVWLLDESRGDAWVGGRGETSCDEWLWGNTYGSFWHNGEYWTGDIEQDDDYQPTHWQPLPELSAKEES